VIHYQLPPLATSKLVSSRGPCAAGVRLVEKVGWSLHLRLQPLARKRSFPMFPAGQAGAKPALDARDTNHAGRGRANSLKTR
jgi:hypothetical protein